MAFNDITTNAASGAAVFPVNFAFPHTSGPTLWRWRKKGWLKTVNICGRQYVSADALADFNRRAAAGEFAQEHKTPKRKLVTQ
jgi:hypothetical protein